MDDAHLVMQLRPMTTQVSTDSICKQCRLAIPIGARLCSLCNSYQDWRGSLAISSNVLALLVALVSVTTAALPAFTSALTNPQSKTQVSRPVVRGLRIEFAVSNTGNGPAVFSQGLISASFLSRAPVKLELENATQAFIKPGSQPLVLRPLWRRDAGDAAHLSGEMRKIQAASTSGDVGFIELVFVETNGVTKRVRYPIGASDVGEIADAKFEVCKNVKPSSDPNCSSWQGAGSDYYDILSGCKAGMIACSLPPVV